MSLVQATFRHAEHNVTPPHYVLNNIYQLPEVEDDEDEDFKQQTQTLKNMIPFAVVGSTQLIEVKDRVRNREHRQKLRVQA